MTLLEPLCWSMEGGGGLGAVSLVRSLQRSSYNQTAADRGWVRNHNINFQSDAKTQGVYWPPCSVFVESGPL